VKVFAKLRRGVLEIASGDECLYAEPSLLQRAYLLWTFRNFQRLSVRVLNRRQRQIVDELAQTAHAARAGRINLALVIGRAEFPPSSARQPWSPAIATPLEQPTQTRSALSGRKDGVKMRWKLPQLITPDRAEGFASPAIQRTRKFARYSLILTLSGTSLVIITGALAQRLWIRGRFSSLPIAKMTPVTIASDEGPATTTAQPAAVALVSTRLPEVTATAKPVISASLQARAQATRASVENTATIAPTKPADTNQPGLHSDAVPEPPRVRVFLAPLAVTYPTIPMSEVTSDKKEILVKALVNANGTVNDVLVPGQTQTLTTAIAKTVKRWRYDPYLLNGEPVPVETQMIFTVLGPDAMTVRFLPPSGSASQQRE
jgi:hypothetical protein